MSNPDRDPGTITDGQVLSARLKANDLGWFGRFDAPTEEWRQVLTAALHEVGLDRKDPDPSRCPMRATDPTTTRRPRDDGWRCGDEAGHSGGHTLYSAEGESVLFAGRWVHPDEVGLTPTSPEEQP